jgi:hypothetical protein
MSRARTMADDVASPTAPEAAPFPGAGEDCPTSEPSPIGVSEAAQALRTAGFTVSEVEGSCGAHVISAMLTNSASSLFTRDVMVSEGLVSCFVLATRHRSVPHVVEGDTAAAHAERRLANLECDLYGADAAGFEERDVSRFDRAFKALQAALGRSD